MKPRIAITSGDPAGIGPEIIYKSLSDESLRAMADFTIIGDKRFFNPKFFSKEFAVKFIHIPSKPSSIKPGQPSAQSGNDAYNYIEEAVNLALKKEVDAIVTAPISKVSLKLAGLKFHGHTEILQKLTKVKQVEMLMVASKLRVILLTRHIPLMKVAQNISEKRIADAVHIAVKYFGKKVRFAICALNPHAGDEGIIGSEETEIIASAVRRLKNNFNVDGPVASDTAFLKMMQGEYDICVAMYHDQAMLPLKVLYPDKVVNVTLGLPFLRTSPGHGVAYDIAGKNKANPSAMIEAIRFAIKNFKLWRN